MRRLPPLLCLTCAATPTLAFLSAPSCRLPLSSALKRSSCMCCGGVEGTQRTSMAGISTAAAPTSHFTSFEMESELLWALEDCKEEVTSTATVAPHCQCHAQPSLSIASSALQPSPLPFTRSRLVAEEADTSSRARTSREKAATPATPGPVLQAPTHQASAKLVLTLSSLLHHPRWPSAAHASRGESAPGFVEAAASTLAALRDEWGRLHALHGTSFAAAVMTSPLQEAHAEALLTLLDLVLSPGEGIIKPATAADDGTAAFTAALLLSLVKLLCRRHVELTGRHMAHLSRLLLAHSPLFGSWHQHQCKDLELCADVWESFALLCYATRRQLRRKHNRDCLEALLWGCYAPYQQQQQHRQRDRSAPEVDDVDADMRATARKGGLRSAVLHHLVYRCLETEPAALISVHAAAHVSLLLSWTLLLAWHSLTPALRDGAIHRLSKRPPFPRALALSRAGARSTIPGSVQQWQQLALRVADEQTRASGDRGTGGRAALPGAKVFLAAELEARHTGGWAIASLDRQLLRCVRCQPSKQTAQVVASDTWTTPFSAVESGKRHVGAARLADHEASEGALRVVEAVHTTLRVYAQMRWATLEGAATGAQKGLPSLRTQRTVAQTLSTRVEAIEAEVVELIHTALELPKHAWCLSEAIAARLVRCVGHRAANVASPSATTGRGGTTSLSVSQRQLLAAFGRLARHSRTDVLSGAVLMQQLEGSGATATADAAGAERDTFSATDFTSAAIAALTQQLASADEAAQVVEVWAHERSMAATPLSTGALHRLHEWVAALPLSWRSEKLSATLVRLAAVDKSVERSVAFSPTPTDTRWSAIVFDAPVIAVVPAPNDGEEHATLTAMTSPTEGACETTPMERTWQLMLQWMWHLNANPLREWRMCTLSRSHAPKHVGASRVVPPWSGVMAVVVAATEADSATQLEQACLRHFLHAGADVRMSSWSRRRDWQWLDAVVAAAKTHPPQPRCGDTAVVGEEEKEKLAPLPTQRQILRHFTLPPATCGTKSDGGGQLSFLPQHNLGLTEAATVSESDALLFLEWDEALHVLAAYAEGATAVDGDVYAAAAKLHLATAAFTRCLVGLWTTFRFVSALPTLLAPPHNSIGVSATLQAHYETASRLHHASSVLGKATTNAQAALPALPGDFHRDVFRGLLWGEESQWQQCEALLSLAEKASDFRTVGTDEGAKAGGDEVLHTPPTAGMGSCVLPDSVYMEVLAAYVASQRPLPPALRRWCSRGSAANPDMK